jgi:hypothetical protein
MSASTSINDGDWIDGKVEWWWKYVIPSEASFWIAIVAQRAQLLAGQDPQPAPWRKAQSLASEAVAMLQAAENINDVNQRSRLLNEVAERLGAAGQALREETTRAVK